MTEADWLASRRPQPMLAFLLEPQSDRNLRLQSQLGLEAAERAYRRYDRKLELFMVACCRRIWHLIADGRSRNLVGVTERYADGLASFEELDAANAAAEAACFDHEPDNLPEVMAYSTAHLWEDDAADIAAHAAGCAARALGSDEANQAAELAAQADLLRDLFGPWPFREVRIDPSWLAWNDGTVVKLAASIADPGGRTGRGGLHERRHPGALPGPQLPRPWLLCP
jgi:hypothetical protein